MRSAMPLSQRGCDSHLPTTGRFRWLTPGFSGTVFYVLSFGMVFSLAAQTDDTGILRGRVVDQAGRPMVAATVVIADLDLETSTGADGRYELGGVSAGNYTVEARSGGFSIDTREGVVVGEGETVELDFQLVALEVPVSEVLVTSSLSSAGETGYVGLPRSRRDQPAASLR